MLTVGDAVLKSADYLKRKGVDSPRLDGEILLCQILNCDRLHLYMDWKKPLHDLEIAAYREFIRRRGEDREPVSRILGKREFYGRDFIVTPDTFSPRPETEGVVERALRLLETESALKESRGAIFEVGTGTGCIIISIALESDHHHYIASEISPETLNIAKKNADHHKVGNRIDFRCGADFTGFEGSIALLVSNPPYIKSGDIPGLDPEVRKFDPMRALDGGADGLDVVRTLASQGGSLMITGGWCVLELGEDHLEEAREVYRSTELFDKIQIEKDYAGLNRYLLARKG